MNGATPSSKLKSRASLPGTSRLLKPNTAQADDERAAALGSSRLLKPSAAKSFEDQRAAAKAWREKTQGIQSRGLFSPTKSPVESDSSNSTKDDVTEAIPIGHRDEKIVDAPVDPEDSLEDIVVLASSIKQKEPEPSVDDHSPFGNGTAQETSIKESVKADQKHTISSLVAPLLHKVATFTGFSSLRFYERCLLLAVLVLSPLWLYHLDLCQLWLNENLPSPCCYKECLLKFIDPVYKRLEVLSIQQVVALVVGGIVMSFTIDRKTAETNTLVCESLQRVKRLCGLDRLLAVSSGTTAPLTLVSKPFTAWFTAVVLMSYGLRILLTQTFVLIVATAKPLLTHIYPIVALLLLLVAIYRYLLHRYRTAKARKELCGQLSVLTKHILQLHSTRPYPIEYVYEEVNDALQRANRKTASPVPAGTAAATGPAAVVFGETGVPLPSEVKPKTVMHSIFNLIFSPSKTSVTVPSHSESEEAQLRRLQLNEIQTLAEQITLGPYSLASLWREVVRLVEGDKRVQTVDLVVDGAQRRCWRVLSGSSGGGLSALFGGSK